MAMDAKQKKILFIAGGVSLLLVILIVLGVVLTPLFAVKDPGGASSDGASSDLTSSTSSEVDGDDEKIPVVTKKYDVTVRIFDEGGKALGKTKFCLSIGPTDFTTDKNGYYVFKNMPVGVHTLSGYDKSGNRIGTTYFQLSTDGVVTFGTYFFEAGADITISFDGDQFIAVTVEEEKDEDEVVITPAVIPTDTTYTDLSWMANIPKECGAYHIGYDSDIDSTNAILNDPSLNYFDTFIVGGRNPDVMKRSAELFVSKDKKIWLSVYDLLYNGSSNKAENLNGEWRAILDEYCAMLKMVAGDNFQGVYFDEPSHRITSADFLRVTKYIRETFHCRVWTIHASPAFLTPYSAGKDIVGYKPRRDDPMVISAENHAYVTDVGWWRYGGHRFYGDFKVAADEFAKAMTMLDPNTRKWVVPVLGTYDWRHDEVDVLTNQYRFIDLHKDMQGFGGIMFYTMWHGVAFDAAKKITEAEHKKRLTDDDYLKENGEFVLDADGNRIVHLKVNNSPCPLPDRYVEGYGYYFVVEKVNGEVRWPTARKYMDTIGNGIKNGKSWTQILGELGNIYMPDKSQFDGANDEEMEQ